MQLRQAAIIFLTSTVVLTQLSGCAAVTPDKGIENSDDVAVVTEEPDLDNVAAGGSTYDITGKPSDNGTYALTNEEISKEYEYGYMMASAMAQNSVSSLKSKAKANAEKLGLTYSDAQAFDLFAYGEAVSSAELACSHYVTSFTYPSDGFQQFIDWRKRYESDHSLSNSELVTSDTPSTPSPSQNTPNTNQGQQKPSGNTSNANGSSNNNSGTSESSGEPWYPDDYNQSKPDVVDSGEMIDKDFSDLNYGFKS
mgnify:FL=1